ncbi:MAG: WYL domain-containing protein [Nitrospirae bacterium]|nr:MAG: WYL domain-containing protein [Nitrospirota bacterium]
MESRKTLQLLYHPLNQTPSGRKVNPYAVHLQNGTLYLIGHCHLTDESFPAPLGFSLIVSGHGRMPRNRSLCKTGSLYGVIYGVFTFDVVQLVPPLRTQFSMDLPSNQWL